MEELAQKIDEIIATMNSNTLPLWVSIVGIFVPILLSVVVIVISIMQHKINKKLQEEIAKQNINMQEQINERDIRIQMHSDILGIYNDFCSAQEAICFMDGRSYLIFSNFFIENGAQLPAIFSNGLNNSLNIVCQAVNRARLLLPQSDDELRKVLCLLFDKYKLLKLKVDEYLHNGVAINIFQNAWAKINGGNFGQFTNYAQLVNNQSAYATYLEYCKTEKTREIDSLIAELRSLFEYDKFDKYFEPYLRLYVEKGGTNA